MEEYNTNNDQPQQGFISGTRVTAPLFEAPHQPVASQPKSSSKAKKGGITAALLAVTLALGMLLGGAGAGLTLALTQHSGPAVTVVTPTQAATSSTGETVAQVQANTITNIYNKVSPSVVRITSTIQGTGRTSGGEAIGTGIVLDKSGDILTNNHVISGASSIKIEMTDGSEYTATVVGTAVQDDLAVIKTTAPADKLTPAELGDSSTIKPGDEVIAIGYPLGLDQSVSSGIISGLDRQAASESGRTLSGLIQTDAAINPGNSGGPLLNDQGQVIGIDTMIESPVQAFTGIGLAIPVNHAKDLIPQLEGGTSVTRPWLGISGTEINSDLQTQYNLPTDKGVLVMDVTAGGPAAVAGIKVSTVSTDGSTISSLGDIITAIDGQAVSSVTDITSYLNNKTAGDKVTLTVIRNGSNQDVSVTLKAWPDNLTTDSTQQQTPTNPFGNGQGNNQTNPFGNGNGN